MKIKKNSKAYKNGIRYKPNLDTIIPNSIKSCELFGLSLLNGFGFPFKQSLSKKEKEELMKPIDKKFEW